MNWTLFLFFVVISAIFVFVLRNNRARFYLFSNVLRPLGYRLYLFERIGMTFHRFMLDKRREEQPNPLPNVYKLGNLRSRHFTEEYTDINYEVFGIPFLSDNYCYMILYESTEKVGSEIVIQTNAIAVDPADAEAVQEFLRRQNKNIRLTYILTTHKHWDHAGGNTVLKQKFPEVVVVGSDIDRVASCTKFVKDGDEFDIDDQIHVRVVHTPCHTTGHVIYVVSLKSNDDPNDAVVFSGDHLFVGGAGALFEGDLKAMKQSMDKLKKDIAWESRIYCGHEYSVQLLYSALMIEPDNEDAEYKLLWARNQRRRNLPTVPTTLLEEVKYNPYLREKVYTMQGIQ